MARIRLRLVAVGLFIIHYASSQSGGLTEAELRERPGGGAEIPPVFADPHPDKFVPPLAPDDDEDERVDGGKGGLRGAALVNPFSPGAFEASGPVQSAVFDVVAGRLRADLGAAGLRQEVLAKFIECTDPRTHGTPRPVRGYWEWLQSVNPPAPGTVTCPPCPGADAPKGYWEWLQSQNPTPPGAVPCQCPPPQGQGAARVYGLPTYWDWLLGASRPVEFVRADQFYVAMSALKRSVERLTVRQNVLYEYARCACPARGECGAALAPVLELMFADNQNVTGEMIGRLVAERRSSLVDTLFGWIPSFSGLISFNPLTVLADLLKPAYAGAASYSTGSGHGGTYTVSSGRPGTEHYVIHHPGGGTSQVSTSTGPGATSVSVVTTDQKKETDGESTDSGISEESHHSIKEDRRDAQDVVQSPPESAATSDVQLSRVSPDAKGAPPEAAPAARQLYGGGPGMAYPALANRVPAQYTGFNPAGFGGVQPGIAAAGVGFNQGLAAAQYTAG